MRESVFKNVNFNHDYYEVVRKLDARELSMMQACFLLHLNKRSIYRYLAAFRKKNLNFFLKKERYNLGSQKFSEKEKKIAINFYLENFEGKYLTDCCDFLKAKKQIDLHPKTLSKWLIDNNIIYKHAWKKTKAFFRKLMSKKLQQEKLSKKQKKEIKNSLYLMDYSQAHFQKPASKYFGELVEMDASSYDWADTGEIWHLHLAVDSHSGAIVGANFDTQETLKGYYKTFKMMYLRHGAPAIIFTDRRTVFIANRDGRPCESLTNFAMAMEYFETILKQSSVPQAKGKVERLNGILQNKLSVFLKIKRIKTIEEANEVLEEFINHYNEKFNKKPISKKSYFTHKVSIEKVNSILAIYSERTFNNGSAFKYKNRYYLAYEDGLRLPVVPKTKGTVIETLDDKILIDINKKVYPVLEISEKEFYSRNTESFEKWEHKQNQIKNQYKPPKNHPWKASYYNSLHSRMQKNNYRL